MNHGNLLTHLAEAVGPGQVLTGADEMAPFGTDWRGRYRGTPLCVVRPATTAEVARVVQLCAAFGTPVVPQGGNTGLCGGATPRGGEVLLSLARLNHVRSVDAANYSLVAEAGCTLMRVQQAATDAGRLFPLSLAAEGTATIGGNLATNAGGLQVLRYGNARELALGLEVVLPDGQVWHGLRALRKDNTGYDLKQVFIGAEGTLGIITAASLRLFAQPRHVLTAWLGADSIADVVALLGCLRDGVGELVTAFELIGDAALSVVAQQFPDLQLPLRGKPAWHVLLECSGGMPMQDVVSGVVASAIESGLVTDAVLATSLAQAEALWQLREHIPEAQKRRGFSIKHDIAVPISRLAEFVARADAALLRQFPQVEVVCFGHVGDGNLHYNLAFADPACATDADLVARATNIVHDIAGELGGTISAEHGIGQLKREMLTRYKSPLELSLMRALKQSIDPQGLMNPGKLL
jgi:FAD/FMN-containing dehydrogenase